MQLTYHGFVGLVSDFLSRHGPEHYLVPVRINGSAIESLFSRFKYNADGNLSAVNYETAMSRLLTATAVDTKNKETFYRNSDIKVHSTLCIKKKKEILSVISSFFVAYGFNSSFRFKVIDFPPLF